MNSRPERLQHLRQLLGERPVDAAVEVEPDVHALRLRRLDALHDVVELLVGADPVELGGRVHLDRVEALRLAACGGLADLVRPVAADPGVGADLVAHLAAEHLPGRAGRARGPSGPTAPARAPASADISTAPPR